jgi:hypothetical protein
MATRAPSAARSESPSRASASRSARAALVSWAALASLAGACGSSGSAGDAGIKGDADGGPFPPACTKQMVTKTGTEPYLITEFGNSTNGKDISWGFGGDTAFSGFSFAYPDAIVSDMSTGEWHLSGTVGDYSGFALGFSCAVDASMFTGISFSIRGDAGATGRLIMEVGTSPDDVNEAAGAASFGQCIPKTGRYDGTCLTPKLDLPVTGTLNTVKLKWSDFKGGAPQPSVSSNSISGLAWRFDWITGATPFPVDVTIDDVMFTVE